MHQVANRSAALQSSGRAILFLEADGWRVLQEPGSLFSTLSLSAELKVIAPVQDDGTHPPERSHHLVLLLITSSRLL